MKHNLRTRTFALLLVCLLALSVLASCASSSNTSTGTSSAAPEITKDPQEALFPEADYGGEEFLVYARRQDAAHYQGFYIVPFEDSADVIDEQAEIRNIRTEERYHIKLKTREVDSPHNTLSSDIASGQVDYKVMLSYRNSMGTLAQRGMFVNFHELECDLTSSWWDKNAAEQYDVGGKLYLMPNDVSVSNIAGTRFFFFSKGILEDYGLKSPYDYAQEDEWTLDNFLGLVKSVQNAGNPDDYGAYGFVEEEDYTVFHMLTGAGVARVEKDADGKLVCNFGTTYAERAQVFFEKYKTVQEKGNCMITIGDAVGKDKRSGITDDMFLHVRQLFTEDHFLFIHTDMEVAAREFKEMQRGFGVIMNPKYNSDQEEYYHQMDSSTLIWGIPNDASIDLEMVSNVFDYWAYCSQSTVMNAFFEVTIKNKRASDPVACEMLDTIKASIRYYPTDIFDVNDTYNVQYAAFHGSVPTAWKTYGSSLEKQLNRLYEKIEEMD